MKSTIFLLIIFFHQCCFGQYAHDSIKVKYGYLHYYTKGTGEPILLTQGNIGASSYYMRGIADSLNNYRCVLVDFQGSGRSRERKEDSIWTTSANRIKDYDLVRRHLKISKWTLLGHSYGGQDALLYAVTHPDNTKKVITVSGVTTDNQVMKHWYDNVNAYTIDADRALLKHIAADTTMDAVIKQKAMTEAGVRASFFNREKAKKFVDQIPSQEWLIASNYAYQSAWMNRSDFYKFDISKQVYKLNIPIRLIQGRQDVNGEGMVVLLNERAKNSKLTFIEKCGHFPWLDQPEHFFNILRQYLTD